ncbi:ester cyclase [Nonomuraea sp. NBC_01738]|uniref:ester cyclase n=1 Tax=Nonomuraea sp. NBC_01738 TaxID=2976003 RepID=UPI002E0F2C2B|nr:ester cyclase [Nonomuraea sp. NBC_01738]
MIAKCYESWLLEMWNGDFGLAHDLVTPDFVGHWPDLDVHGAAELIRILEQGHAPFEDVRVTLDVGPIVQGDLVAARWTFAALFRRRHVSFSGHDILRAAGDGRFAEYWVVSDALGLERQLV